MVISPGKLEKYSDFLSKHSNEGVYDPKKGLCGLLSILTPDTKSVVLAGMQSGTIYFSERQLYKDVLVWLGNQGVPKKAFPVSFRAGWEYCELKSDQETSDGSLVKIGAVVKQAKLISDWEEERIGYIKSTPGLELAAPLLPYVCDFVYRAGESDIPHRYDSMWRLIGAVHSKTVQRRPLAVFKIVEFLNQNQGSHRTTDIEEGLTGQIDDNIVSVVLNSLGDAGVIDYHSPHRDIQGKRAQGWSRYGLKDRQKLQDLNSLYKSIQDKRPTFYDIGYLRKAVRYIQENPEITFEIDGLAARLGIDKRNISRVVSSLSLIGVIEPQSRYKSSASANDLTRMFYDGVLLPAKMVADTLTPPPSRSLAASKLFYYLQNYQEERSSIGPKGGEENRSLIMTIIADLNKPTKLSHIVVRFNAQSERRLSPKTLESHLDYLIKEELLKRSQRGYYELAKKT